MTTRTVAAVHPGWVRSVHWTHVVAFFVLISSGWQIYDADPFWVGPFPAWLTLGGSLPGALQWHFTAMWLLVGNGLLALTLGVASGRLRRLYLTLGPAASWRDLTALLRGRLAHSSTDQRNAVQRVAYGTVLVLLVVMASTGVAMWKPVQFQVLAGFFGGYECARRIHFAGMALLGAFVIGHVALALSAPRLLLAMLGMRLRSRKESRS